MLLTPPRDCGCRAGGLKPSAVVAYVFMQTCSSMAPTRITQHMGLIVLPSKVETENSAGTTDWCWSLSFYFQALKEHSDAISVNNKTKLSIEKYHEVILKLAPNKKLLSLELVAKPVSRSHPLGKLFISICYYNCSSKRSWMLIENKGFTQYCSWWQPWEVYIFFVYIK